MTKKIKEGDVFHTTTVTITEIKDGNVVLEIDQLGEKRTVEFEHHGELQQEDLDVYISEVLDIIDQD